MQRLLPFLLLLLLSFVLEAQPADCGDTFFDPGGEFGDYASFTDQTVNVCPTSGTPGDAVTVTFNAIDLSPGAGIDIYDGDFGDFLGNATAAGQQYQSTDPSGCLTVYFFEFDGGTGPGYSATVSCGPAPACNQPTGVFLDGRTATSLTIDWNSDTDGTSDDVAVLAAGAPFSGSPTATSATSPYTAMGLTTGTTYDVYVRTNCGGSASIWSGPFPFTTLPPAPGNDECGGATNVLISADDGCGNAVSGSMLSATTSTVSTGCSGDPDDIDVWFSFTPATSSVLIDISGTGGFEGGGFTSVEGEVYGGTCGSLASLGCDSRVTGLTPGTEYFIRAYDFDGSENDFSVCITAQADPPVNDECGGAIGLTVSPTPSCSASVAATTDGASSSLAACGNGSADDDVWFSFTAIATSQLLYLDNINSVVGFDEDMNYEVFSGGCGGLTSVYCGPTFFSFDDPPVILPGLTVGTAYFLRVYTEDDSTVDFDICLATPPPNDECEAAIVLPVNAGTDCTLETVATTIGATRSGADCGIARADDDVWFAFVATRESHRLNISNVAFTGGFNETMFYELIEGATCGAGTVLSCSDINDFAGTDFSGLTIGETYLLRVFTRISGNQADFTLCITSPPVNDECSGATSLVVNPDLTTTLRNAASTVGATQSDTNLPASCSGNSNGDDVWYQFTALAAEHFVRVENVVIVRGSATVDNVIVRIYSGADCDNRAEVTCDFLDPENPSDVMTVSGLTPGESYYVLTYGQNFNNELAFDLIVQTDPSAILPVELTSFTGEVMDKENVLYWTTASEENVQWHILERSRNGREAWQEVARTQGARLGTTERGYTASDENPLTEAYYRLRSVDYDLAQSISSLVRLVRTAGTRLSVYPNPVGDRLEVRWSSVNDGLLPLQLLSANGAKIIATERPVIEGENTISVDLSAVPPGVYFLRVGENTVRVVRR